MIIRVSNSFTRPANTTAYGAADVIGPATGSGLLEFTVPKRAIAIRGAFVESSSTLTDSVGIYIVTSSTYNPGVDNATFTAPGFSDGVVTVLVAPAALYGVVGTVVNSDSGGNAFASAAPVTLQDTKVYAALSTVSGFTPASGQQFRAHLFVEVSDVQY